MSPGGSRLRAARTVLGRTWIRPPYRAARGLGPLLPLLRAVRVIRRADLGELRRIEVVERIIQEAGLRHEVRDVYGSDSMHMNDGPGLWQIPNQLASCMCELSRHRIDSVLEVGTCDGWTITLLTAYLQRFNPGIRAITIDIGDFFVGYPIVKRLLPVEFRLGVTSDGLSGQRFDLCFIDGDHSLGWVSRDYENVGKHARICMFHDVNDRIVGDHPDNAGGVPQFWRSLKAAGGDRHGFREYTYHSDGRPVMGIGLLLPR